MPSVRHVSGVRLKQERGHASLSSVHTLSIGEQSDDPPRNLKKALPSSADVHLSADLVLLISVAINGASLSIHEARRSLIVDHLVQYFRKNASNLSIIHVSKPYVEEECDEVRVNITPKYSSHAQPLAASSATLNSIHLTYKLRTGKEFKGSPITAFNLELLNELMDKFVTHKLTKRYPLIFGTWIQKFTEESRLFSTTAEALLAMYERSPNTQFQSQVRRHLKLIKKRLKTISKEGRAIIDQCCGTEDDDDSIIPIDTVVQSNNDALCMGLQQLFRLSIRPPLFKGQPVTDDELLAMSNEEHNGPGSEILSTRQDDRPVPETFSDVYKSSEELAIRQSEDGSAGSTWDDTFWPALPSPPSSFPLNDSLPVRRNPPITLSPDSDSSFDDPSFQVQHEPHVTLELDEDMQHSAVCDSEVALLSDHSASEHLGPQKAPGRTHVLSDFDFTEDEAPLTPVLFEEGYEDDECYNYTPDDSTVSTGDQDEKKSQERINAGFSAGTRWNTDDPRFPRSARYDGNSSVTFGPLAHVLSDSEDSICSDGDQTSRREPAPSMSFEGNNYMQQGETVDSFGLDFGCESEEGGHEMAVDGIPLNPKVAATSASDQAWPVANDGNLPRHKIAGAGTGGALFVDLAWDMEEQDEVAFGIVDMEMESGEEEELRRKRELAGEELDLDSDC